MKKDRFEIFAPYNEECFLGIKEYGDIELDSWQLIRMNKDNNGYFYISCNDSRLELKNNQKYEYRFLITPVGKSEETVSISDPKAYEVHKEDNYNSVIIYENNKLKLDDFDWKDTDNKPLPNNNEIIIYELPPKWSNATIVGNIELGIGTFEDIKYKIKDHILEPYGLGINTIQLLPISESPDTFEWGYGPRHFFAPDPDLGTPIQLKELIRFCHKHEIRVFLDMVMNHAKNCPLEKIHYNYYFIDINKLEDRIEAEGRFSFGGRLFKYTYFDHKYNIFPAREFHKKNIQYWINEYHIDGIRIDSISNIKNWDFIGEITTVVQKKLENKKPYLVIGEDIPPRIDLIRQGRVQALWNENFKYRIRKAILGRISREEIYRMINPLFDGFYDLSQVINYLGSHDVAGIGNERIMNFLGNNNIFDDEAFKRIKFAFSILMTSVGIPMILAGDEFGDIHDLSIEHPEKQIDPVNWSRKESQRNKDLFNYVKALIKLRKTNIALKVNECNFIYEDFYDNKKLIIYQRGFKNKKVMVIANFSDQFLPNYYIPNLFTGYNWKRWTPSGEIYVSPGDFSQNIYPFEAKIFLIN